MASRITRIVAIAAALALVAVPLVVLRSCESARTAGTQAKLSAGQGQAAIESGADAVQTIGNATARETEIHQTVKDATDAIAHAPAGDSNDAADRAACQLRTYRDQPRCRALFHSGAR